VAFALLGAALIVGVAGYALIATLNQSAVAPVDLHVENLRNPGNAPPDVRLSVLASLRGFQDGYVHRDPKSVEPFMSRLFEQSDDVLILGAGPNEWARGYLAATDFIRRDWVAWGEFRFSVDDSIVSSHGDVAWVASTGTVHWGRLNRPVYFSAVLTRQGDRWLFHQIHFQYGDRAASALRSLLHRP